MSEQENGWPENPQWQELKLPELLFTETVRELHATIDNEWDSLQRSACQTAAGRALWKHVTHDPLAELLAGETHLRNIHEKIKKDRLDNAREISGVILAIRTLWFDSQIEAALNSFNGRDAQVVLLGADLGQVIETNSAQFLLLRKSPSLKILLRQQPLQRCRVKIIQRLSCLKECDIFEVDFAEVLQVKTTLIQEAMASRDDQQHLKMTSKSLTRVAADIRENDWLEKLQISGFKSEKNTMWVLEGIIYYLSHTHAMQVLKIIADKCAVVHTVLLADFMNKPSTTLSNSVFHFYSDWPDHLLPSLGFSHVKLSQIGDPDAHFGLMHDPLNLFNKLRSLPRSVETHPDDGTPCRRLYLVQASGSPSQTTP